MTVIMEIEIVPTKTEIEIENGAVVAVIVDLPVVIVTDTLTISMTDLVVAEVILGNRTDRHLFRMDITLRRPIFSKDTRAGTVF